MNTFPNQLVSILVPVYNVESYLSQCLDSLINQTYNNLQIVLIDDGSKDNSWSIMQDYATKDNRIEIYHQENAGVATTRNNLLEKIKGEYVLFVDSDDWIELDMVEFLINKAINEGTDMVVCGNVVNDTRPALDYTEEIWSQDKVIKEFLRHVHFNGSLWNKLISFRLLKKQPTFHREISYGEDALFTWQLIQEVQNVVVTNKQLYHYRRNDGSLSHAKWSPDKKGTGHIVWETICDNVKKNYPQYSAIANARFALEDMWALYFASISNYPYDEHISIRQQNVKQNLKIIRQTKLDSIDRYFSSWLLCRWYESGKLLKFLKQIIR